MITITAERPQSDRLARRVIVLCLLAAFVDGIDTQLVAIAVPLIARDWALPVTSFAPVFAAFSAGLVIGSVVAGWSSDKLSLKTTLLAAVTVVGLSTLAVPFTGSIASLGSVRFVGGAGIGGAMVTIVAICTRVGTGGNGERMALFVYIGAPLGYLAASLGFAPLLDAGLWKPLFFIGAGITLAMVAAMAIGLPSIERVERPLARSENCSPTGGLFGGLQTARTILLWAIMLIGFTATYLLINWLPSILTQAGLSAGDAAISGSVVYVGSIVGTLAIAAVSGRYHVSKVLPLTFLLGTVAALVIQAIGPASGAPALAVLTVLGLAVVGGQIALMVLSASLYDERYRGRGIGWANGFGRTGSLAGPALGGFLLNSSALSDKIFLALAMLVGLCGAGTAALGVLMRRPETPGARVS